MKIVIGGVEYQLIEVKEFKMSGTISHSSFLNCIIEIVPDLPLDRKRDFIFREISGAIFYEAGVFDENEWQLYDQFGKILSRFVYENTFHWLDSKKPLYPHRVTINGFSYIVEFNDKHLEAIDCMGQIKHDKLKIHIKTDLVPARSRKVFLHEIVHGLLYEAGFEDHQDDDLVRPLTTVLYYFLKENDFDEIT